MIGIVALIFLGPRRMPEMARKLGKMMADFRNTTNEFKSTWEREVNFEDEARALRTGDISPEPVARDVSIANAINHDAPEVKTIDPDTARSMLTGNEDRPPLKAVKQIEENTEKRDWL